MFHLKKELPLSHFSKKIIHLPVFILLFFLQFSSGSYNVARGKNAISSSVLNGYPAWNAAKAVDGNVNQNVYCGSCLHTQENQNREAEYLQVDLGDLFTINMIETFFVRMVSKPCNNDNSTDTTTNVEVQQRSVNYTLLISRYQQIIGSGFFCYRDDTNDATQFNLTQRTKCYGTGRYISLIQTQKPRGLLGPILEVCELEAYGCPLGRYGENCDMICSEQCIDSVCDPDTGICLQGCRDGWFGKNCSETKNLAYMKYAVSSSHLSMYPKWNAAKAVDGNENNNLFCGFCLHTGNTPGTPAYLTVDLGTMSTFNKVQIYFVKYDQLNCSFQDKVSTTVPERSLGYTVLIGTGEENKTCFQQNGKNFSFIENILCLGTGKYITVLQRNPSSGKIGPILEICELKVFGCKNGYFGDTCEERCHENCNRGICDPDTGACWHGCTPGWSGVRCSEVSDNYTATNEQLPQGHGYLIEVSVAVVVVILIVVVAVGRKYIRKFINKCRTCRLEEENGRYMAQVIVQTERNYESTYISTSQQQQAHGATSFAREH